MSPQVFDYDRLCPTDDLLGTTEVFFTTERLETDEKHGGQQVSSTQVAAYLLVSSASEVEMSYSVAT